MTQKITYSQLKSTKPKIELRLLKLSDAQAIYKNLNNRAITRWLINIPYPYHLQDAIAYIKKSLVLRKKKTQYDFGIILKNTKDLIGSIGLTDIDSKHRHGKIGYWLSEKYWRKGIMTEAVNLALGFAFNNLKLHRVYATVLADNTASIRVLEKNNFQLEGIFFEHIWKNKTRHNLFYYAILKKDYKKQLRN
ncbi:MAG: GNAT family N-acetyltransferase [candidate division WOR-3 bacterium]|nr:GNAT family N-acetyltransferase [candidate division WOR-3 bacterium]